MTTPEPLLSICCLTYNQAQYIRQCLEGFMMQKTDFAFEVLIHDDASTDGTADIIREYEAKFPEIIKPIYQTENQYSKGIEITGVYQFPRAKGKYIAMCEGDDYWTDPMKLQKQVDFLEANPQYDICSHRFKILDDERKTWVEPVPHPPMDDSEAGIEFDLKSLLEVWSAQTMTLVFRSEKLLSAGIEKYEKFCDFHLCYLLTKSKKGFCMNMDSAVYRLNAGGVFGKQVLERKTYMGYYTTRDLFIHNQEDEVLAKNYYINREAFFENYIRLSVYKRKFSKLWLKELSTYLGEEYRKNGIKAVIFVFKKIILSFVKSFKSKK